MTVVQDEETANERELRKENERWKDYANALLIAMPVLLVGLTLSKQGAGYSIASAIACFVGIVLVTLWYGRDSNLSRFTPGGKYPTFLYYASVCFGLQVASLAFALIIALIERT
jgi:hypothetical protein